MKKYHISDLDGIQQNETYMMQNGGFLGEQRMSIGDRTRWFALIVLCLGTLMIVLDTTIVNVALASLTCGLANSQVLLIGARAVQGLGGSVVSAVALSLVMNLFTEPAERAKAMGVFGFVAAG